MDSKRSVNLEDKCDRCNLCDSTGTIGDSRDIAKIFSNVREFQDEAFTIWRCRNCSSLHCQEAVDLDRYYANYFLQQQQLDYFTRAGFRQRRRWLQAAGVKREHRILEFGCGNGIYLDYLRGCGFQHLRGYDPYGSKHDESPKADELYDVVMSYEVIEHVADPRSYLSKQASFLKPGGLIAVSTPNGDQIQLSERYRLDLHQPYHRHILSKQALIGIARELGLEVVQFRNSFWMHTKWPFVNWKFISEYVWQLGNLVDVVTEDPKVGAVLASPKMLSYGFWGGYLPMKMYMHAVFRKSETL